MNKFTTIYKQYLYESVKTYYEEMKYISSLFDKYDINHVFIGGALLPMYEYYRNTGDVDILVDKKDKNKIKNISIGYIKFSDTYRHGIVHKIKTAIDVLYSGDKIGDKGNLKLPNVDGVKSIQKEIPVLDLKKLIEFKLGSGLYANDRFNDFPDIKYLIKYNKLKKEFIQNIEKELVQKYQELWQEVNK